MLSNDNSKYQKLWFSVIKTSCFFKNGKPCLCRKTAALIAYCTLKSSLRCFKQLASILPGITAGAEQRSQVLCSEIKGTARLIVPCNVGTHCKEHLRFMTQRILNPFFIMEHSTVCYCCQILYNPGTQLQDAIWVLTHGLRN